VNRPAGKVKARPTKTPPRKPYVEHDDGKNFARFVGVVKSVLGLTASQAASVRKIAKKPTRHRETWESPGRRKP